MASVQQPARFPEPPRCLPATSTNTSSPFTATKAKGPQSQRYYQPQDMAIFNLLEHPIWIFDIEKQAIWWANTAALGVWKCCGICPWRYRSSIFTGKLWSRTLKLWTCLVVRALQ